MTTVNVTFGKLEICKAKFNKFFGELVKIYAFPAVSKDLNFKNSQGDCDLENSLEIRMPLARSSSPASLDSTNNKYAPRSLYIHVDVKLNLIYTER